MNFFQKISWHLIRKIFASLFYFRFLIYPYVKIAGIKIPVSYKWSFPILKALYNKEYEGGELHIIKQTIDENDRILEIGTGLGLISAFCAKKIGSEKIKTFEANPLLEKKIRKLYEINEVCPELNISLISDKVGVVKFYAEHRNIWASSLLKLSDSAMEMNLITVDIRQVIQDFKPNYLIMDIEGAEYDLLPIVDFSGINKIQVELHKKYIGENKVLELISFLSKSGLICDKELSKDEQYYFYRAL